MKNKEISIPVKNDLDLELKIKNLMDKAKIATERSTVTRSSFLDPFEQKIAYAHLKKYFNQISCEFYGGSDNSERKILVIYPKGETKNTKNLAEYIKPLIIYGIFENLSHRDVLGSIMALGIKRETIGDIIIYPDKIIIIVLSEIADYIIFNLIKIKNIKIKHIEISDLDSLELPEISYDTLNKTVNSMRVDAIISAVCNIPREDSQNLCKRGLVKVNWEIVVKPHRLIKENDLISIKGYGRYSLMAIKGKTKSGRISIIVQKYK